MYFDKHKKKERKNLKKLNLNFSMLAVQQSITVSYSMLFEWFFFAVVFGNLASSLNFQRDIFPRLTRFKKLKKELVIVFFNGRIISNYLLRKTKNKLEVNFVL
jgi:hypothetical protein